MRLYAVGIILGLIAIGVGGVFGIILVILTILLIRSFVLRGLLFIQAYRYLFLHLDNKMPVAEANMEALSLTSAQSQQYADDAAAFAHRATGGNQLNLIFYARMNGFIGGGILDKIHAALMTGGYQQ